MKRKKNAEVNTKTPVSKEYYIFKPRLITRLEQGVDLFAKENDVPGERQQGEAGVSRSDTSAGKKTGNNSKTEIPKPDNSKTTSREKQKKADQGGGSKSLSAEKPSKSDVRPSQRKEKCGPTSTREAGKAIIPGTKEHGSVTPGTSSSKESAATAPRSTPPEKSTLGKDSHEKTQYGSNSTKPKHLEQCLNDLSIQRHMVVRPMIPTKLVTFHVLQMPPMELGARV
ncbi:hypothetical protein ACRRTK_000962 [Alexandromys fortis]